MSNRTLGVPHIDLTTTAVDVTTGLVDGSWELQVAGPEAAYFVGGATAPTDFDDYWEVRRGGKLRFVVGTDAPAFWLRAATTARAGPVALRRFPDRTWPARALCRPHFSATTTPTDLRGSLAAGEYRGVVRGLTYGNHPHIYGGAAAPTEIDDYWHLSGGSWFLFTVGATPIWARTGRGSSGFVNIEGGPRP